MVGLLVFKEPTVAAREETFPLFKQWKADMQRVNFNKITEDEYRLHRWLWQNQKS